MKVLQVLSLRGRRSRNKVSVGEPAEGSFENMFIDVKSRCSKISFLESGDVEQH